jgi:hypothetical protein
MTVLNLNSNPNGRAFSAWVCGCSLAGIAGSNSTEVVDVCPFEYWLLSGRCLWDGPITRQVWYI